MSKGKEYGWDRIKEREDEISAFIREEALSHPFVTSLSLSTADAITESIARGILGIGTEDGKAKSVRISKGDEGIVVDIYINILYETNIPELAYELQTDIKTKLEREFGISCQKINIRVQGVELYD